MLELLDMDFAEMIRAAEWDSLIVNRRKPHTYRAFTFDGDLRICLHRFEPCEASEAFMHPHPWPGAFLVLDGQGGLRPGLASFVPTGVWWWGEWDGETSKRLKVKKSK